MESLKSMYDRLIKAMGVEGLKIPVTMVKFYRHGDEIPEEVMENHPDNISITSCQADKQASIGDATCLTRKNIGCIAAAISLGLVDENDENPLEGPRVYTEIMRDHAFNKEDFIPPSPKDFTNGTVYACHDAGRPEFGLFGKSDCGRYKDVETAKQAIIEMMAIQPAIMKAVFFFHPYYQEIEIIPDIVVMSIRPVELTRFISAYQYNTGKRINASMGGLRAVNSDLIARPYLTGEINIAPYCLGSRLIAKIDPDRLGIGIPFSEFKKIVKGMEDSRCGFPFHKYPGASD